MTQITTEEIIAKIPGLKMYASNPDLLRKLYDDLNPKKDLKGLKEGDFVNGADVLVAGILSTSSYIGCPVCYSGRKDVPEGVSFECKNAKCNQQRVAVRFNKCQLLAGDPTTKIILDFPPFSNYKLDDGRKLLAKVVTIRGRVTKMKQDIVNGEVKGDTPVVSVKDLAIVSDVRDNGEAVPEPASTPATPPPTAPSSPPSPPSPITNIPEAKLKNFKTFMRVMAKATTESQLKAYVEGTLKLKLEDVLPLLDKTHLDSQNTDVYKLKPEYN